MSVLAILGLLAAERGATALRSRLRSGRSLSSEESRSGGWRPAN